MTDNSKGPTARSVLYRTLVATVMIMPLLVSLGCGDSDDPNTTDAALTIDAPSVDAAAADAGYELAVAW